GVALAQNHHRGAGIDQEIDVPALDPGIGVEMAVAAGRQLHFVLAGRGLHRLFDRLHRCRLRRWLSDRFIGVTREIAAGDERGDGEEKDLTHGKTRYLRSNIRMRLPKAALTPEL